MFFFLDLCNTNKTKLKISNTTSENKSKIYCTKYTGPRDSADYVDANAPINLDSFNNQQFENFEEIQTFLDRTTWFEPSAEELNEINLEILDLDSVEKCFDMIEKDYMKNTNHLKDINISNINQFKSVPNSFTKLQIENFKTGKEKTVVLFDDNDKFHIKSGGCSDVYSILQTWENELVQSICTKNFLSKLKSYINECTLSNIKSYSRCLSYLKRLEDISEVCIIFKEHQHKINEYYTIFNILNERELIKELNKLYLRFSKRYDFNEKTCRNFSIAFKKQFFFDAKSIDLLAKINKLTDDKKKCLFYFELKKLHRYISEVPELLTLGGLFENYSFSNVTFVMYIINLFA
jgi:hypothetical protein